jgi:hypothetical protein
MPIELDLPNGLNKFVVYNAIEVTDSRWDYDLAFRGRPKRHDH